MTKTKTGTWQSIFSTRMLICLLTGFSSGLPLFVLINLLPVWFSAQGVSLRDIGLLALILLPYNWKFLWAPLVDRYSPFGLGRRRGWLILTQSGLLLTTAAIGLLEPKSATISVAFIALVIALLSATQDIVIDAYRREILPDNELGLGNAVFVNSYKVAALVPGSLSLVLSDHISWGAVFIITAAFSLVGLLTTFFISEPVAHTRAVRTLQQAVIEPFIEFFKRQGLLSASALLAFMFCYKLGDSMAVSLASPFYLSLGFTKTQIGLIAKNAGLWPNVLGGLLGGIWMVKIGINRALWIFGVLQTVVILGMYILAESGPSQSLLATILALENFSFGLGTAAFVAFIARTASRTHVATQLALFTALAALPRSLLNSLSGFLVSGLPQDSSQLYRDLFELVSIPQSGMGWSNYFLLCYVLALPGMFLLLKVAPWNEVASNATTN